MAKEKRVCCIIDLQSRVSYDPKTGILIWKPKEEITNNEVAWNLRYAGKKAFCQNSSGGHFFGSMDKKSYPAHRIAWALSYNKWPDGDIDHIDGNPKNNKIENLRDVSHATNLKNRGVMSNNTTGVAGVYKRDNKWIAQIFPDGKRISLGSFRTLDEAALARKKAEEKYGFITRN